MFLLIRRYNTVVPYCQKYTLTDCFFSPLGFYARTWSQITIHSVCHHSLNPLILHNISGPFLLVKMS